MNRPLFISAALVGCLYLAAAYAFFGTGGMFAGDSAILYLQAKGLSGPGGAHAAFSYPAASIDPDLRLFPFRDAFHGKFTWGTRTERYGKYSEAFARIASIFYRLAGPEGLPLPALAFGVGALLVAALIAAAAGVRALWAIPLVLGLCTPVGYHALQFSSHTAGLFLAALSLLLSIRYIARGSPAAIAAAGASIGLATAFRPEMGLLLAAVPAGLLLVLRARKAWVRSVLFLAAGALLTLAPQLARNYLRSGSLLGPQIVTEAGVHAERPESQLHVARMHLLPAGPKKWALVAGMALAAWLLARRRRERLAEIAGMRPAYVPLLIACFGYAAITLAHLRGGYLPHIALTDVFPAAIAGLFAAFVFRDLLPAEKKGLTFLLSAVALFVLLVAFTAANWGGRGWGPRYALLSYLPLSILVCLALERHWRERHSRSLTALVAGAGLSLLMLSFFVQGAGLVRERRERREFAAISDGALSLASAPILTDLAVYPQLVAPAWDRLLVLGAVSCREVHAAVAQQIGRAHV